VQYPDSQVKDMQDLRAIPLRGPNATRSTRLDMVSQVSKFESPTEVDHYQLRRVTDIYVQTVGEDLGRVANSIDKLIAESEDKSAVKSPAKSDEAKLATKAVVQIGAFSTEELATKAFHDAVHLGGGKMSGKAMRIVPIAKGDETLWRVAAVGFTSKEDAQAVCDSLKAAGRTCFVR